MEHDGHSGTQPHMLHPITRLVAATVEKQNGLLTALQVFLQRFIQCLTDRVRPPCSGFSANIGNRHLWKCSALITLTQCEHGISPLLCTVIAFDGRCGRTQYEDLLYTALCHIAGVVAWRLFGFVRTVLLFVQNDQTEVTYGCENCRARSDYNPGTAGTNFFPAVVPFTS